MATHSKKPAPKTNQPKPVTVTMVVQCNSAAEAFNLGEELLGTWDKDISVMSVTIDNLPDTVKLK